MVYQQIFTIKTPGRGMTNITSQVSEIVTQAKIETGICNLFLHHTSASLIICENADPSVQSDMEAFMLRLIPDGDRLFKHTMEGPDDMPAHVRTVLTQSSLSIPITQYYLALGMWQGLFIWEHRLKSHDRKITITII